MADLSLVVDPFEMACHMFSMSSLPWFSLVILLQPYILFEPDVVLSIPLVLSHVVTFVAKGIDVCFGLALLGGGALCVVCVSVVVDASVAVTLPRRCHILFNLAWPLLHKADESMALSLLISWLLLRL